MAIMISIILIFISLLIAACERKSGDATRTPDKGASPTPSISPTNRPSASPSVTPTPAASPSYICDGSSSLEAGSSAYTCKQYRMEGYTRTETDSIEPSCDGSKINGGGCQGTSCVSWDSSYDCAQEKYRMTDASGNPIEIPKTCLVKIDGLGKKMAVCVPGCQMQTSGGHTYCYQGHNGRKYEGAYCNGLGGICTNINCEAPSEYAQYSACSGQCTPCPSGTDCKSTQGANGVYTASCVPKPSPSPVASASPSGSVTPDSSPDASPTYT